MLRALYVLLMSMSIAALSGCSDKDDFDARFDRERQAIEQQGAAIENAVANDMTAAREAERARAESGNRADAWRTMN
ncbi:hypothetical protein [Rhizorhapis sp. SPR117]|uniref:hypothetical protein n=1 Tax=Rhizorhapis sp. SPR117 TaxID=2912611 RepID=UPI001F397132|nr:hypothetical protein [Rhizorhapis sp. SPR117]